MKLIITLLFDIFLIQAVTGNKKNKRQRVIDDVWISDNVNTTEKCQIACQMNYDPVCGTDGKTYRNVCHLRYQQCLTGTNVQAAYPGECAGLENGMVLSRDCQKACPYIDIPVCGTNGVNYDNTCQLDVDACRKRIDISVNKVGKCHEHHKLHLMTDHRKGSGHNKSNSLRAKTSLHLLFMSVIAAGLSL